MYIKWWCLFCSVVGSGPLGHHGNFFCQPSPPISTNFRLERTNFRSRTLIPCCTLTHLTSVLHRDRCSVLHRDHCSVLHRDHCSIRATQQLSVRTTQQLSVRATQQLSVCATQQLSVRATEQLSVDATEQLSETFPWYPSNTDFF